MRMMDMRHPPIPTPPCRPLPRRPLKRRFCRPGIALVLVLAVIGLASILGMAMLASASLQAQVKSNNVRAAHAQYLAESGASLAMYYLQNPGAAPLLVDGFYPGERGIGLRAEPGDIVDVSVEDFANRTYDITAVGHSGPTSESSVLRQVRVRAYVESRYVIDRAASFAGNFTVPAGMTMTGNVRCDGTLINAGGTLGGGTLQAVASNVSGWTGLPAYPVHAVPAPQQLNIVRTLSESRPRYIYTDGNGQQHTGYAQEISDTVPITALPPAHANNPLNVWYARSSDIWLADCDITGSIVALGTRKLVVAGAARVRPAGRLPAIVAGGGVRFCADLPSNSLAVEGLLYCCGSIDTTGGGDAYRCTTTIDGALMMAATNPVISDKYHGTIDVAFQAAHLDLPDLTAVDQTPLSVRVIRWGS